MNGAPILFLLGPAGTGKTTLGGWLEADLGLAHLDMDQYPGKGFDIEKLREDWDHFWNSGHPDRLATAVRRRATAAGRRGAVLSFPSVVMLTAERVRSAQAEGIVSVVMYGSGAECLDAFMERERVLQRGLDQKHWIKNNNQAYMLYSRREYAPCRMNAFDSGTRRSRASLVAEIGSRLDALGAGADG